MIRKIIQIDEGKCNGCGLCAVACHEGAIGIVNGKAKLLRDDYCDGLGDCLPACPTDAISFVWREAAEYNEAAVMAAKAASRHSGAQPEKLTWFPSHLQNFPVQLKLVPPVAPWFYGADLLIAADCTAFSYGNFHNDFIRGKVTLIGCPKLDGVQYADKLAQILQNNEIRSVTVARMTVPCCGGLTWAVQQALERSGKQIPLRIVTISPDGKIASDTQ